MAAMPEKQTLINESAQYGPMFIFAFWGVLSKFILHIKKNLVAATLVDFLQYQAVGLFSAFLSVFLCDGQGFTAGQMLGIAGVSAFMGPALLMIFEHGFSSVLRKLFARLSQ